jgi:predicted PurR-regulated permease PerM
MDFRDEIRLFISKMLILFIVVGMLLSISLISTGAALASLSKILNAKINSLTADQRHWLEEMPNQLVALPPNKRQELHQKLTNFAQEIQPYLVDLQPIFEAISADKSCKGRQ